jgi:hypothetical protein
LVAILVAGGVAVFKRRAVKKKLNRAFFNCGCCQKELGPMASVEEGATQPLRGERDTWDDVT